MGKTKLPVDFFFYAYIKHVMVRSIVIANDNYYQIGIDNKSLMKYTKHRKTQMIIIIK